MTTRTHTGYVKKWMADRGFGFLTVESPKGERDVFLHISAVNHAGIQNVSEGDRLAFNISFDNKSGRTKACDIAMVM
jgi:CspA family cold shock protein